MMNLFIVFDPISFFSLSLNWASFLFIFLFMFLYNKFYMYSGFHNMFLFVKMYLGNVFKEVSGEFSKGLVFLSFSIFLLLFVMNLLGLFPFVFTLFSHPSLSLSLGLVLWMTFFIMGWFKGFISSSAHLVPYGSPMILAPFMVVIESISHLIRPFTLSIRLAANMMAGHLIIGLLASTSLVSWGSFMVCVLMQTLMMLLEVGVCVIQSFVFSILLMLYVVEYY